MNLYSRFANQIRESMGIDGDDHSRDDELKALLPIEKWRAYLEYNGILTMTVDLHEAHDEIFSNINRPYNSLATPEQPLIEEG